MFARFVRSFRNSTTTQNQKNVAEASHWSGLEAMESRTLMSGDVVPTETLSLNFTKIKFETALLLPAVQATREAAR